MTRKVWTFILVTFVLGLLAACSSVTDGAGDVPTKAASHPAEVEAILAEVNAIREAGFTCGERGYFAPAEPLKFEARLMEAAQKHSEDRAEAQIPGHITPEGAVHYKPGTTFYERITEEGYSFSLAGENVGFGFTSPEAVMAAWLDSDGHCANIMNPDFEHLGAGHAESYWTQKFAAPL